MEHSRGRRDRRLEGSATRASRARRCLRTCTALAVPFFGALVASSTPCCASCSLGAIAAAPTATPAAALAFALATLASPAPAISTAAPTLTTSASHVLLRWHHVDDLLRDPQVLDVIATDGHLRQSPEAIAVA
eukprot:CAMPEP_0174718514 /NCGR_PEP_ID=MMETSP1094-20130205/29164_1 /TAXON_ID=156173 /ORGANISM="Chrysochromulina brevifilum, Strain UTEX LB 985" /LENGTH=132 /DNA_ID=CAMNT_0015918643 /DNA_START=168 /DNA_END=566 /DNA_ORIENTATION=-